MLQNTRGGEFRNENQLSTKRIMALYFQMLSFFTDNNNLNACQKLEKNLKFACLGFLLNPSSPQPPPCPFPKCVQKIKSVRNLCAMSPVFSGSEKI